MLQSQHCLISYQFFFGVLARIVPETSGFNFPRTLIQLQKLMGTQQVSTVRYVYCERCSRVYACIEKLEVESSLKYVLLELQTIASLVKEIY